MDYKIGDLSTVYEYIRNITCIIYIYMNVRYDIYIYLCVILCVYTLQIYTLYIQCIYIYIHILIRICGKGTSLSPVAKNGGSVVAYAQF